MMTIGLVGGVASGKSRVAQTLVELGAGLLDADRAGHAVLDADAEVRQALCERWGDAVVSADGGVDRKAIARRVFGKIPAAATEREFLEGLLHPRIRERLEAEARNLAAAGRAAVVLDAPLLLEAGWKSFCDIVLFVDAPRESRLSRAQKRGWSESDFDMREAAQWPVERKREAADAVIDNSGTEGELRTAVHAFWQQHIATQ
jgi:dephospho-CoA kinase